MRSRTLLLLGRLMLIGLVALIFAAAVITGTSRRAPVNRRAKRVYSEAEIKKRTEQLRVLMRRGVGSEVMLASANARPEEVRASVESAMRLIHYRSGLAIDEEAVNRLVSMEARTLKGESGLITAD